MISIEINCYFYPLSCFKISTSPMKQVLSSSIVLLPGTDPLDNQYSFQVATKVSSCIIIDLAELLKEYRNDRVEFKKDYKLWNDVYA
jgi:hypothetical protein